MSEQEALSVFSLLIVLPIISMILVTYFMFSNNAFFILREGLVFFLELLTIPINSLKDRLLGVILQNILSTLFNKTIDFYFIQGKSISYGDILVLLISFSLLITFQALSITNIVTIAEILSPFIIEIASILIPFIIYNVFLVIKFIKGFITRAKQFKKTFAFWLFFSLFAIFFELSVRVIAILLEAIAIITLLWLLLLKIMVIKHTKTFLKNAKHFERMAFRCYRKNQLSNTLSQYYQALKLYNLPLIIKNAKFNPDRAKVLKNIAFVLHKDSQLDKALLRCNQALGIYQQLEIDEDSVLMKEQVQLLKLTAKILCKQKRREEALEYYKLIYTLTGTSAMPKGFFA